MDRKILIRWSITILGCLGIIVTIVCVCSLLIPVYYDTFNSSRINGYSADLGIAAGVLLTLLGIVSFCLSIEEKTHLACICFYLIVTMSLSTASLVTAVDHITNFNTERANDILQRLKAIAAVNGISLVFEVSLIFHNSVFIIIYITVLYIEMFIIKLFLLNVLRIIK